MKKTLITAVVALSFVSSIAQAEDLDPAHHAAELRCSSVFLMMQNVAEEQEQYGRASGYQMRFKRIVEHHELWKYTEEQRSPYLTQAYDTMTGDDAGEREALLEFCMRNFF